MYRFISFALVGVAPLLLACGTPQPVSQESQQQASELLQTGRLLYGEGNVTDAIVNYSDAIALDPNNAIAYANRGGALAAQEDYGKAIADYDCAIRLDPSMAGAYGGRGLAHHLSGDTSTGVADLWEAAQLFREQGRMDDYYRTLTIIQRLAP